MTEYSSFLDEESLITSTTGDEHLNAGDVPSVVEFFGRPIVDAETTTDNLTHEEDISVAAEREDKIVYNVEQEYTAAELSETYEKVDIWLVFNIVYGKFCNSQDRRHSKGAFGG